MATIKSFTSIEQSRKLVEILPIESADMKWFIPADNEGGFTEEVTFIENKSEYSLLDKVTDWNDTPYVPCWSLAALLDVLPNKLQIALAINDYQGDIKERYAIGSFNSDIYNCYADNPVDACYEMILKLHELKML